MTVDEIKAQYDMRAILDMYSIKVNKNGFISCPFHREKTASMKVYKDSVYCYGCGLSADIFTFVQKMENCSFKDAFKRLGGSYSDKTDWERNLFKYRTVCAKMSRLRSEERLRKRLAVVSEDVSFWRNIKNLAEPFTDMWCEAINCFVNAYIEYVEILEKLGVFCHDN